MSSSSAAILTPAEISVILWEAMGSSATNAGWWWSLSLVLQGLIVYMILAKIFEYYEYLTGEDSVYVLEAVALGGILSVGALGVRAAEVYKLLHYGETGLADIYRFVLFSEMSFILLGAMTNCAIGIFYLWRAYKMANVTRYVLPVLALGLLVQLALALVTVSTSFQTPSFAPANQDKAYSVMNKTTKYLKIWCAVTTSIDCTICLTMSFALLYSKKRVFHNQTRLLTRLLALLWETMLPPVICMVILASRYAPSNSRLKFDWTFVLLAAIPLLYFHSVLHTLVARRTVRSVMDDQLAKRGLGLSSHSHHHNDGRVYVSNPMPKSNGKQASQTKEYEYEMKTELATGPRPQAPSFRTPLVTIEQSVVTSDRDPYPNSDTAPSRLQEVTVNGRPRFPGWSA